jgi:hypothetical protein
MKKITYTTTTNFLLQLTTINYNYIIYYYYC